MPWYFNNKIWNHICHTIKCHKNETEHIQYDIALLWFGWIVQFNDQTLLMQGCENFVHKAVELITSQLAYYWLLVVRLQECKNGMCHKSQAKNSSRSKMLFNKFLCTVFFQCTDHHFKFFTGNILFHWLVFLQLLKALYVVDILFSISQSWVSKKEHPGFNWWVLFMVVLYVIQMFSIWKRICVHVSLYILYTYWSHYHVELQLNKTVNKNIGHHQLIPSMFQASKLKPVFQVRHMA